MNSTAKQNPNEKRRKQTARKTTTSTDVKRRYNEKVYKRIYLQLPNELVTAFKNKCIKLNVSQASVLKEAIEKFLEDE
jgi:hypothetical protein